MMTPGSANALLLADAGYQIQRSVRTRGAYPTSPSYFSRTAGTPTNNLKWTVSLWLKQGVLSVGQNILTAGTGTSASEDYLCFFASQNRLGFVQDNASSTYLTTAQLFRDPSAWYHILFVYDSAQATASNRAIFYVNGVQVTALNAATYPTLNQASKINSSGLLHRISSRTYAVTEGFDGYLTDINFIDGQALTPASFGEYNAITGVWSAKKYAGTYGTNGFFLNFSDNSAATAAAIGKDSSGNGNNWTPSGVSVTAGVTYDSMLDVPLGAGGPERGNYAVLNAASIGADATLSNGNLTIAYGGVGTRNATMATIGMSSGKWYWECTILSAGTPTIGITNNPSASSVPNYPGFSANGWGYVNDGDKYNNGSATAYGANYTTNDIMGVAFDADAGSITFYKNNVSQGVAFSGLAVNTYFPAFGDGSALGTWSGAANFGQRPFAYTPPTGFKALHTGNLPEPVIKQGASYMAATTYTGNGSTQSISNAVNGVSFQPDFVWIKRRDAAASHALIDSVRGISNQLVSNLTNAEATGCTDGITSLNSNGFSLGAGTLGYITNTNGATLVGWQWKANGAAVSNTAGSITSQVSAGVSQGFSVVTYTGTGTGTPTIGHGLGVAPSMVIAKTRSTANGWLVYHQSLGATKSIILNGTNAASTQADWGNTTPTSTVFYVNGGNNNISAATYVAYCFTPVAGYSAFGSYTGNGSADGPFVYLGFRPRYILLKKTDTAGNNWFIWDTSRDLYNPEQNYLWPNSSSAEAVDVAVDALSNGFKPRVTSANYNASGGTYIFAAFAEAPFKNSLAR